jgi:hypothetical protein
MKTLVLEKPRDERRGIAARGQGAGQAQQALAERFLKLCEAWCQELIALGQESPVLSVQALEGGRLQLILRNGSRWIVQRAKGG